MIQQQGLLRDKILFRILKNKSPEINNICEKLNQNVKNIILLSEDELCELWQHMKTILLEAQKLYTQTSNNNSKYTKECNLMIKVIRTVTAMAMETISQRIFIPNVLLENTMLLHSIILSNIKDEQAKNEISCLMENWWKLNLTWKEKVIINVLKYLSQSCKSSLQHVKRLYEIRSAIPLLNCTEDVQELIKLVREKTMMSLEEGRSIILYLFTLGEQYILGIHNNIKVILQSVGHNYISRYANLYVTAWSNVNGKLKNFIVENCFQNIVFQCFRSYRDHSGRGKLGKNLLYFLTTMHENKNQAARLMIHNQCKSLLWKHLKAPGSYIRCNAAEILFITTSIYYTHPSQNRSRTYLRKYYEAIIDLLNDSNDEVCIVTLNCIFEVLEKHWSHVPTNVVKEWLNIFLHYTKNSNNPEIRANVFIGLRRIFSKEKSRKILMNFLPNFSNSIYDEDNDVIEALIKVLWYAQNHVGIPFWDIVPLTYILDRLETTRDIFLLQELTELVWLRIYRNNTNNDKIVRELENIGLGNINAIRKFCFHSKYVLNWDMSSKIVEIILSKIQKETKYLSVMNTRKRKSDKRAKLNANETRIENETGKVEEEEKDEEAKEDMNNYKNLQLYIDVIAILLVKNLHNINRQSNEAEMNILQEIANVFTECPKHFKKAPVNESVIFLFSLIPPTYFFNNVAVIEMLVQQLCDINTTDDVVLTVIYVLMKWEKGEAIIFALINLFKQSFDINIQNNQEDSNNMDGFSIHKKGLELSLRILKHLLHVEFQSVLMNKYHQDVLKFWETLQVLKTFIRKALDNKVNVYSLITKDLILQLFNEYISMIFLLHKVDVFEASEHFSDTLLWIKKMIVPHIPNTDNIENEIPTDLIISIFDFSNQLLKKDECTPKLCCDIVLLYCSCLSVSNNIAFLNNAFSAIINLLEFSQIAYKNKEPNLLNVVLPNFVCVTMVNLTRYNQNELAKQTNNLKALSQITRKYFSVIKDAYNDQQMCLPYMTIMFNTAISNISTKLTQVLQSATTITINELIIKFPYLAKKILSIILHAKRYQRLSIQILSKTIRSYTKIDMLSALVIIYKMLQSSDKKLINSLKNITLATKIHNQNQSYDTPFDRSINDAMTTVMDTILQQ